MTNTKIPKDLEERFTQPKGWRSHHFESNGMRIAFGSVFPEDSVPDAVVVCEKLEYYDNRTEMMIQLHIKGQKLCTVS